MGATAIAGGIMQSNATSSAASTEAGAAEQSAQLQHQAFEQAAGYLNPYVQAGTNNLVNAQSYMSNNALLNGTSTFNAGTAGIPYASSTGAFNFNGSDLANTPGYQFILQQGENAANNSMAASGLGVSGAQAKGIASYASGLANTTYNEQYQNQLNAYNSSYANALNSFNTNYNVASQQYGRYSGLAQQGLSAGESLAQAAQGTAQAEGQAIQGGAQAQAAGTIGSANALTGALSGVSNGYITANLLNGYGSNALLGTSAANDGGGSTVYDSSGLGTNLPFLSASSG